jgi:hypothetical protein
VQIDGQNDALGSFIFRTTGYNSVRTLAARLAYFEAASGGQTHYLPLMLKLRAKSTTLSHRAPVYYVDLVLRDGVDLAQAVHAAKSKSAEERNLGLDRAALETAAHAMFANGAFEDTTEETPMMLEEYFTAVEGLDMRYEASDAQETGEAGYVDATNPNIVNPIPASPSTIAGGTLIQAKRMKANPATAVST